MQPRRESSASRLPGRCLTLFASMLMVTAVLATTVSAQEDGVKPERGFTAAGSYALSNIESIDLSGGNMVLNVPLASLPAGRGGSHGYRLNLRYNSKLFNSFKQVEWDLATSRKIDKQYLGDTPEGGWHYSLDYSLELHNRLNNYPDPESVPQPGSPEYIHRYKLFVHFPDGSTREFHPRASASHLHGFYEVTPYDGAVYYSADGSYIRLQFGSDGDGNWQNNTWTLSFPDGGRVTSDRRHYDRNGNYTAITGVTLANGHPATKIADELGRAIYIEYDPTVHPDGTRHDYVFTAGFGNEELRWTVKWKEVHVYKTFYADARGGNLYPNQWWGPWDVVRQIVLPAQTGGLSYGFGYNAPDADPYPNNSHGWGELNTVTLPSGAQVSYSYLRDGLHALNWQRALENHVVTKTLTYLQEYDGSSTQASETWTYGTLSVGSSLPSHGPGRVKNPDDGVLSEGYDRAANSPFLGKPLTTSRPDGTLVERYWRENRSPWMGGQSVNPYVKTEFTSIRNAAGALIKTAITDYDYDRNGNVTGVAQYDWVPYGDVQRDSQNRPTGVIPAGATLKRVTTNTYYNPTPAATDTVTDDPDTYHYASAPLLRTAVQSSEVREGSGQVLSRAEFTYDDPNARGNLTERKTWDSIKGGYSNPLVTSNSVSVSTQYDNFGNPTLITDAGGTQTKLTYGSVNGILNLYPTRTEAAFGTPLQRTSTAEYDFWTGLVTLSTDVDNDVSTRTSYDAFGRPVLVKAAEGTPTETRTATSYFDAARRVVVHSDLDAAGDGKLVGVQHYDQLGRVRLTRTLEDAAQSAANESLGIKVQTRYRFGNSDPFSYVLVSQPYRAATSGGAPDGTQGWTLSKRDQGGRTVAVQTFAGSSLPAPWGTTGSTNTAGTGTVTSTYDAEFTTVTDQDGKKRVSKMDGLGRLGEVWEVAPNDPAKYPGVESIPAPVPSGLPQPAAGYRTAYSYDALGNLRRVQQGGQLRFFMYDSLSRLVRAKNPEQEANQNLNVTDVLTQNGQWSLGYSYDDNGNLKTRTDARGVTATYGYDALNRVTTTTYTGEPGTATTPNVVRSYDGATYGKGLLWKSETLGASGTLTTVNTYDALGRPLSQSQQFKTGGAWGAQFTAQQTYDRAGNVRGQTYPSGRTVSYGYDPAGRLNDFRGTLGGGASRVYATDFHFDGQGRKDQERFGTQTPVYNKHFYNSRGQLAEIRVATQPITGSDPGFWNRGAFINHYSNSGWGATGGGADNNGNLRKQDVYIPNDDQISGHSLTTFFYEYDALNRLEWVKEGRGGVDQWRQQYDYDRWGNRTINAGGTWLGQPSAPPSDAVNEKQFDKTNAADTNRLYAPGDTSLPMAQRLMQYDAAGNLLRDAYTGGGVRTYDAEGRMTSAEFLAGQTQSALYTYDADGRRVKRKIGAGAEVWQVYGPGGELLAEYAAGASPTSPQKEYGYRGGELLVTAEAPARFNVALSANGGTAAASSTYSQPNWVYSPGGAIDGNRRGSSLGAGHWSAWHDTTPGVFDDTLEITFSGPKTIDEIDVFTLQDNYANPAEPTEALTFNTYGLSGFELQYWDGAAWVNVPGGSVSASNKVWRRITFPAVTTGRIRVLTKTSVDGYSRIAEVEAWGTAASIAPADVVADFSSTQNPAGAWTYGYRAGGGAFTPYGVHSQQFGAGLDSWSTGTCCPSVTRNSTATTRNYAGVVEQPADLLHIHPGPNGEKSVVRWTAAAAGTYSVSGRFQGINTVGATTDVAVTKNGATTFSGSVNGTGAQAPFTMSVTVGAGDTLEFQVGYGSNGTYNNDSTGLAVTITAAGGGGASGADVRWVVTDQLGTPRMVFDHTGNLTSPDGQSGMTRHDYFPFGEEVFAAGRTTAQGYGISDGMRQGYTGYEKDGETGLNFAQARYHSPMQGRFTSPDPLLTSARLAVPQSWNRYTYCINNPLLYVDPSGLDWIKNKETRDVTWVKPRTEIDTEKYEILTGDALNYNISDTQSVRLNPNGPDSNAEVGSDAWRGWGYGDYIQDASMSDEPFNATGYWDFNVNFGTKYFVGPTGGVMFTEGAIHPYLGLGVIAPRGFGWSSTYSPDSITEGINGELQLTVPAFGRNRPGITFVHGVDSNGDTFQGFGTGSPGASATGYYVLPNMRDLIQPFITPRPPLLPMPTNQPRNQR